VREKPNPAAAMDHNSSLGLGSVLRYSGAYRFKIEQLRSVQYSWSGSGSGSPL